MVLLHSEGQRLEVPPNPSWSCSAAGEKGGELRPATALTEAAAWGASHSLPGSWQPLGAGLDAAAPLGYSCFLAGDGVEEGRACCGSESAPSRVCGKAFITVTCFQMENPSPRLIPFVNAV